MPRNHCLRTPPPGNVSAETSAIASCCSLVLQPVAPARSPPRPRPRIEARCRRHGPRRGFSPPRFGGRGLPGVEVTHRQFAGRGLPDVEVTAPPFGGRGLPGVKATAPRFSSRGLLASRLPRRPSSDGRSSQRPACERPNVPWTDLGSRDRRDPRHRPQPPAGSADSPCAARSPAHDPQGPRHASAHTSHARCEPRDLPANPAQPLVHHPITVRCPVARPQDLSRRPSEARAPPERPGCRRSPLSPGNSPRRTSSAPYRLRR